MTIAGMLNSFVTTAEWLLQPPELLRAAVTLLLRGLPMSFDVTSASTTMFWVVVEKELLSKNHLSDSTLTRSVTLCVM
jgi:hypothetical protein